MFEQQNRENEAVARVITGEIEENLKELGEMWTYERITLYLQFLQTQNTGKKVLGILSANPTNRGRPRKEYIR